MGAEDEIEDEILRDKFDIENVFKQYIKRLVPLILVLILSLVINFLKELSRTDRIDSKPFLVLLLVLTVIELISFTWVVCRIVSNNIKDRSTILYRIAIGFGCITSISFVINNEESLISMIKVVISYINSNMAVTFTQVYYTVTGICLVSFIVTLVLVLYCRKREGR